jgi:2-methylcitrate dehydratase PrpD
VSGATTDVVRISRKVAREAPECTLATARLCVLDFFGLAIAGSREPVARILGQAARLEGASPVATAIGHGHHFSLQQATFLNGVAGHALDYDDVALAMHVHPTTVILPPLLALAEARGFSYDEVLRAFVAGYEAAGMVGAWLGSGPYDRGFHMTGTVGCIGAAAGAAYLLDLDEQACARALGLAATQAAGLKAQFGTMAKPLHAGRAAETGLLAALWAGAGLTGRENVLEAQQGFAATQSEIPAQPISWQGYQLDANAFKLHAACFGVHGTIEAITSLRAQGLRFEDVRQVYVKVGERADRMCNIANPRNGTEAKFSLRFVAALALHGRDTADPASFADAVVDDPALAMAQALVQVNLAGSDWPEETTQVTIATQDGRSMSASTDMSVGQPLDKSSARIRRKFDVLLAGAGFEGSGEGLAADLLRSTPRQSLAELIQLAG